MQGWLASASEFLKSLDPNHLVAAGTEGFFGSSTPGARLCNLVSLPSNFYGCKLRSAQRQSVGRTNGRAALGLPSPQSL